MTKKLISLILSLFIATTAFSQYKISGKIVDEKNQPIPFASVFIKNTSKGISANAEGYYVLSSDKTSLTLVFTAIGFKPLENVVNLTAESTLNIQLKEEFYSLKGVTIKNTGEDPAYGIMRKAIALRKEHLGEIKGYSTDVYIKGLQKIVGAPKKFLGRDVQKNLELDSNRQGIMYLSESQSKFSYQQPNQIHEEMVSSKISGRNNAFSFNKASDFIINFYQNYLLEGTGLSSRSFVSPLADNALFYYKYKLLGTSDENGTKTYKIQVSPKRKADPAFHGVIYIADQTWHLTGTNLDLTKEVGINFVDTLNISQQYIKTQDYYVPSSMKFMFNGSVLGFKFAGYYVGVYSNYQINPKFPKNFFNAEILKVTKSVNKKDSLYWANNRPIPLTEEEDEDYRKKDSIALLKQTKPYLDSLEKENNKFGIGKFIMTGHSFNDRYHGHSITFDPILTSVFYNTVEGFAMKYGVTYRKNLTDRKYYSLRPELRYGYKNKTLTGSLRGSYYYDPLKRASVGFGFGNEIADLNRYGSNSLRSNSINGLLFERNLSKFYKRSFANINTTRELADGLQAYLDVNYSRNFTLQNTTDFTFKDYPDRQFTSNNPFTPDSETPLFPTYNSFNFTASLVYTIGQKYVTRPDGKFYEESKYPRIQLSYKKGLKGVLNSDVDYDLLSAEIYQSDIRLGLFGYSSFSLGAGKFLNNNTVYYPDSKHFWGNNSTLFPPNLRRFRYLDFYIYNTDKQYFEAHFEHNFAGFITHKIPLVRDLKLEEFVGINYLTQPDKRNYTEYYVGLKRLIFSISYGWAYDGNKKVDEGIRFTYSFGL